MMETTLTLLKLTCAFALIGSAAMAQDLVPYSEAGGWSVVVDTTLGNGCLLTSEFEDGSTVRIGFDRNAGNGYVAAFNADWGDIEDGTAYPLTFLLDEESYDAEGHGMHLSDVPGVVIAFDNVDFLTDLAARNVMILQHDGTDVMSIDLAGSDEAIAETIACQEVQG
jgi:hypothetical protein